MSNTFDKLSVLDSFIEEVNSYLPEIEANLERLAQSPGDMEALEETYRRTHTIGGSASMMDFPGLAHVAHGMEDILYDVQDGIASLDAPTIGLLQRSLGRLHRLLEGVREGIDENAVIAEDDADYVQYRAALDSLAQISSESVGTTGQLESPFASAEQGKSSSSSSMPTLDEVLASFRTPIPTADTAQGDDVAWPEDIATVSYTTSPSLQEEQQQERQYEAPRPEETQRSGSLEMLAAMMQQPIVQQPTIPMSNVQNADEQAYDALDLLYEDETKQHATGVFSNQQGYERFPDKSLGTYNAGVGTPNEHAPLPVLGDMRQEAQSLALQTSSLQEMLQQLRMAMSVVEAQRAEFKGFLNGSKDALERMEDWAGQAMGLNLRNSPEQVRRFLPLSVMWVANTKLKKVFDLLAQITNGVEMTEEQIQALVQQLQRSIEACGKAFEQLQSDNTAGMFTHDPGWSPWDMQVSREADALRERVTFERRGDPSVLRAEIEAQLRQELQHEYESRPLTLANRHELEQQIRHEILQEFEAKRQLQESVAGREKTESVVEIEARLRSEIEIQVRQEFLSQITTGDMDISKVSVQSLVPPSPTIPRVSNFADQARIATGLTELEHPQSPSTYPGQASPVSPKSASTASQVVSSPPPVFQTPVDAMVPPPLPPSVAQQQTASSLSSSHASLYSGDLGEEAADIFRLEAEEHLQTISFHVAALEKDPSNRDLIQGIRRATHTLKGAAGMMGFRSIAELSHISEDLLESIIEGNTVVTPAVLGLVLDTAEILDQLINSNGADSQDDNEKVQILRKRYEILLGEQSASLVSLDEEIDADIDAADDLEVSVNSVFVGGQSAGTNAQRANRGDLSVRVRLQKLDELVNLFGELLVNRSILEERIERLIRLVSEVGISSNRLRDVGQKLESRFEAATLPSGHSVQVMPGEGNRNLKNGQSFNGNGNRGRVEPEHFADFDELELDRYTEFHQLARGLSETVSDMSTLGIDMEAVIRECESVFARENRLNTTFQDRLMKARLVPLSTMTPRLYRAARSVALKQHKEFEFLLEGEATEVDRTVYEEIAGPLLHLMRNAVNHAIETPDVRVQHGKPPVGHIKLSAAYEGNQVVITVRDDGKGIDPENVRNAAIARGLIRPNQTLSDSDVIDFVFQPGFSTAEVLSEESGRGVGLDVVRDSVSRLRGSLEVESTPGQGTAFTMKFPTSLAIQSAMMVRVGGEQFAIPTVMVESIGRLDNFQHTTVGGQPAVVVQNDRYPLTMLSQLLSLPENAVNEKAQLLFVNTGGYRVALVIDEIKGKLDVVMKNLGPHLRSVRGIAGGTVMGNGRVVLVLELLELLSAQNRAIARSAGPSMNTALREGFVVPSSHVTPRPTTVIRNSQNQQNQQSLSATVATHPPAPAPQQDHGKHVLVVDDSPSVRRVVGNMLKQHGWEVQMARDGVEALEMISRETPAAVLLDIEMPRMDGYELIATVRAQEQYRTLPLVVLTSRAAGKHQQRAMQLGASGYVVKPYQDGELISTLNSLVYGAATR
ncbi:MAG TPA: response regulator [Ktedonobacteraceae bacterium]|nr:response regulator [Ktedonobacteraceae bacterium]